MKPVMFCIILAVATRYAISSEILDNNVPQFLTTMNVTQRTPKLKITVLQKPRHLFIGRCSPKDKLYHQENIILNNQNKMHILANIRIGVDGPIYISCVKVLDQMPPGDGAYPSYSGGGVGYNFVTFDATTVYGKGFKYHVEIYGRDLKNKGI